MRKNHLIIMLASSILAANAFASEVRTRPSPRTVPTPDQLRKMRLEERHPGAANPSTGATKSTDTKSSAPQKTGAPVMPTMPNRPRDR
ncbi:MAG: hypothetical protein SFT91_01240 [Rickettsiaceae bacterium]|nr:hypothetical protein [Rickettsiaceae bacterium]